MRGVEIGTNRIEEGISLLHEDGDVVEIRAFNSKGYATNRYFTNAHNAAVHAAKEERQGRNVYQTLNLLPADLANREAEGTKDGEIKRRRWLMVDADPVRPSGISASEAERGEARAVADDIVAYLRKRGWTDPHVFDSGNGFHLLYPIDLPNDDDARELVKGALEGLMLRFGTEAVKVDASVHNASRVTRVYGTMNRKGKDAEPRPHRRSGLISRGPGHAGGVVGADQLRELLPPEKPKAPTPLRRGSQATLGRPMNVGAWLEEWGVAVKKSGPYEGGWKWILEECPEQGHTDNSAYIIQFAGGGISAGCSHDSCKGGRDDNAWHEWRAHFQPGWTPTRKPVTGDSNDSNDSDSRELRELPDPERFPVEVFPRSVSRLVREAAASMGCPADFLAVGALACMSMAIGDTRKISIKKGWTEGAAVYAMIVGGAASKKSPALYEAVRPVLMRQLALKAEYDRQREEYEIELARCDKDDEKPRKPVMGRTYVDDTTVEKLADILKENRRGVGLIKDELSGWLGSMDQYKQGGKGGDRQKWLQIHTNRPISVDRKSSEEPVIIPRPFVSIFGGIQPEVLPDFGKDRGDGLIDRFVAAYPEPMVGRWTDDEISDEAREGYKALIDSLYRLEPAEHEGGEFASSVDMSDEGKAVFVSEYNRLHEEIETPGFPQRLRPVYGKLEGYLARFALILAMARRAEARLSGGATMERVGREDMEGAAALLYYFKNHARRVYTGLYADSTVDNLAADIRSFLIDNDYKWEGTASDLYKAFESEYKPARPEDLAKAVRAIAKRSPLLRFENLKRTKTSRGFRLTLENAVTAVTAVTPSQNGTRASAAWEETF